MNGVLAQTAGLIVCGIVWRRFQPGGLEGESTRRVLTGVVYHLLLPALVLGVLWQAPMNGDAIRIAVVAAAGVLAAMATAWAIYRFLPAPFSTAGGPAVGALILAAAFGNVTYLGLPVLESAFGPWARAVAIEYDLFACTPLLLTLGIAIAQRYGHDPSGQSPLQALLRVPPLWAALAAIAWNLGGVPLHPWRAGGLAMWGAGVVPLMLFSVGLGLRWSGGWKRRLPLLLPAVAIQLLLTPLLVAWLGGWIGLSGDVLRAVVVEAAMPSMVLGIVLCDRFGLDTPLYAEAVTLSTILVAVTLPMWFGSF